ncbi:hypothetical protein UPYG_G00116060 [Umbra pygmaea]|uniref:Endothelial cell-specific chemotaxis regulator n=1 Tax=Umbra pygmaea TaxID=75934 RepID=A0ABD0XP43_UMBPY
MDLLQYFFMGLTVFLLIPAAQSATNQTNGTESMGGPSHPPMHGTVSTETPLSTLKQTSTSVVATTTILTVDHPVNDVASTTALSTPGNNPHATSTTVLQSNESTTSAGKNSSGIIAPTPQSAQPYSATATSTAQAQIICATSQDTATEPAAATLAPSLSSGTSGTSTGEPTGTQTDILPTQSSGKGLTMLAFGVMSLILILIIIMVVLVTVVTLRERCSKLKEEGKKSHDSVVSESNITSNGEKESITLVSMKTINSETDTDSPQVSSIHSTTLSYEEQELV